MTNPIATELQEWIEGNLVVPSGQDRGDRIRLMDWQRSFIAGAFAEDVSVAAIGISRGNGKSSTAAMIAAAAFYPGGPLFEEGQEIIALAASLTQGRTILRMATGMLGLRTGRKGTEWSIMDSVHTCRIKHNPSGTELRVHGSKSATMHGYNPRLIICDEMARWEPAQVEDLWAACRTSLGKVPGSKLLAIGTRPGDDGHRFSKLLDGEAGYSQRHEYRGAAWLTPRAAKRANPSWDRFPFLWWEIEKERKALRKRPDPAGEDSYREFRLNAGTQGGVRRVLTAAQLRSVEGDALMIDAPYVLAIDLSSGVDLAGAAACTLGSPHHAVGLAFWPELPAIAERDKQDAAGGKYVAAVESGDLILTPGRVTSVRDVFALCLERFKAWPEAVVIDRWRQVEVEAHLADIGYSEEQGNLVVRGMGFQSAGQDIRAFQQTAVSGNVRIRKSTLTRLSFSQAEVVGDPAGNLKFSKSSSTPARRRRDDIAVAVVLATAEAVRQSQETPEQVTYIYGN